MKPVVEATVSYDIILSRHELRSVALEAELRRHFIHWIGLHLALNFQWSHIATGRQLPSRF
jgi:hypothetical protein